MKLAGTRLAHTPSREGLTTPSKAGPVWNGKVRFNEQWLDQPWRWRTPRRIFVCAHGDLFHESVPDEWIDKVFAVMAVSALHQFQVLTKRPERMRKYMQERFGAQSNICSYAAEITRKPLMGAVVAMTMKKNGCLPNVWLGVSVEDQRRADERIPILMDTPAAVRFLSVEPLLGPVSLAGFSQKNPLHWVIVGGESGPGARPMHPAWPRLLRDECETAGVPFFFKQWGDWREPEEDEEFNTAYGRDGKPPAFLVDRDNGTVHCFYPKENLPCEEEDARYKAMLCVGKKKAGRLLDGREWNEMPILEELVPQ